MYAPYSRKKRTAAALLTVLAGSAGNALALPAMTSDNLNFATADQPMFGLDQSTLVNKPFKVAVVDIDTGPQSIGEITELSQSFPNPAYLAWKVAWDSCTALFSSSACRDGANIPFVGRVGGLGSAPSKTVSVSLGKNGLKLSSDVDVEAGFTGGVTLDGGKVDVTYPTQVSLSANQTAYRAGDNVLLSLGESRGTPSMATEFSDLDLSFKVYTDFDVSAGVEAYVAGVGGGNATNIVNWDTGYVEQEIAGIGIGGNIAGDKDAVLRLFGQPTIGFDSSGGIGANIPVTVDYPSPESPIKVPLADLQGQIPEMDTPPNSTWDGTKLTNTQLPINRQVAQDDLTLVGGGTGFHPTDVLKADIDVDGVISAGVFSTTGVPAFFGLTGGVTGILSLEGNLVDFDMGAFFGFGQTMTFTPTLMAELAFNMPVMVKNDQGVYELVSSWTMAVGDQLDMIFPDGDLIVSPTYFLDGVFSNLTEFLISPVASLAILQLKLSGLAAEIFGLSFDAALVQNAFPLGGPISAATLYDNSYKLPFDSVGGTALSLARISNQTGGVVPVPGVLWLMGLGIVGLVVRRMRAA